MYKRSSLNSYSLFWILVILSALIPCAVQGQYQVFTYAGTGSPGFVNGDTSIASFNTPFGMAIDSEGNIYIADGGNNVIRKISTDGIVSTFAGTGSPGYLDGPADQAMFDSPINICFDPDGNMFVSDFLNQRIRKISTTGEVTTVAGSGVAGLLEGAALEAQFNYPRGICMDDAGNLYIGDSWNHRIRRITPSGNVSTWAGGGSVIGVQSVGGYVDGPGKNARFYTPTEVSIDANNNLYIADAFNHRIRKIDVDQEVTTVAGSGTTGPNFGGFQNGPGDIAQFKVPTACHVTLDGNIFVGDGSNDRIRKIDTDNNVTTFAGSGDAGFVDGLDSLAKFNFPRAIVKDYERNRMYVVDFNNNAIRYIEPQTITSSTELEKMSFHVFPNPFTDRFMIEAKSNIENLDVTIYNTLGQQVFMTSIKNASRVEEYKVNNLPTGGYNLLISKDNKTLFSKRLVKGVH